MAKTISKALRSKPAPGTRRLVLLCVVFLVLLLLLSSVSTGGVGLSSQQTLIDYLVRSPRSRRQNTLSRRYLYWGNRIDCPGKHCDTCADLGHQESGIRCALEEAMFLNRTFVMPSQMCINPIHNKKGILRRSDNETTDESWAARFCAVDSLYDIDLISEKIPVILDDSKTWRVVLSTSMKLGERGIAHVQGVSRRELKDRSRYSNLLLINQPASPLAWFVECKDRNNVMFPYSFLPTMAAKRWRDAAEKIKAQLGDYDAIHVRRGDKLKTRKDRFGVERSLYRHLDRDTRPEFILRRIEKWVPPGQTLFVASKERSPKYFAPLCQVIASLEYMEGLYRLAYSSDYSDVLDPVIENNDQLFMVERLIMMGAKTFIRAIKDDETDLTLTDDAEKNTKVWQIPVYTMDEPRS